MADRNSSCEPEIDSYSPTEHHCRNDEKWRNIEVCEGICHSGIIRNPMTYYC